MAACHGCQSRGTPHSSAHYDPGAGNPESTLYPPSRLLADQRRHRRNPGRVIVQTRTAVQLLAAGALERLAGLASDLVDCLQAIAGESWGGHEDAANALFGKSNQRFFGVRLEPFLAAKERLKRLRPLFARPAQPPKQSRRGPLDVRGVGIAALSVADGDAVKAQ